MFEATGTRYRPPAPMAGVVDHPRLPSLTRRGANRPLVTITAAPGWGKTVLAMQWAERTGASWCTLLDSDRDPVALATTLVAAHPGSPPFEPTSRDPAELAVQVVRAWAVTGPARIVLDDAQVLLRSPGLQLLARVCAAAVPGSQLVVVSHDDLGLVGPRDRASGTALELDATHLDLGTDRVAQLLAEELTADGPLAARLVDATGGWPAGIRLLLEALHDLAADERSARLGALTGSDGPVGAYVTTVLLPAIGEATSRLLVQLALAGPVGIDRLAALLGATPPAADTARKQLLARGLVRLDPADPAVRRIEVAPTVRRVLIDRVLQNRGDRVQLVDEVVGGLLGDGALGRGLEVLTVADRPDAAADLLEQHGDALIRAGELRTVAEAAAALPEDRRSTRVARLHGQALAFRGEWAAALRCLGAVAEEEDDGPLETGLALGLGIVHHLRGDLDAAIATYARGPASDRDDPGHAALVAWRSTAHWLRGEVDEARRYADQAMAEAAATGDDAALAYAHTAAAMVAASDGDHRANVVHYDHALAAARRAGDELQQSRILTNRGSLHLENGEYEDALRETDRALDLAERQGFAMIVGVARCNRAEILLRTGRLDEAIVDAEAARDEFARIGSRNESYAHHLLGDARREQGDLVLARLAYERALRLAEPSGDRQGQVPALVGLSRTLVGTDPDAAGRAAERALELDEGMYTIEAHMAAAWVALARGDRDEARRVADGAAAEAERRENRAGTAAALTLLAVLDDDPIPGLTEAARAWWQVGARLSATRAELGIARRSTSATARAEALALERRLHDWGCSPDGGAFAHRAVAASALRVRPQVRVLGAFVVERDGRPVPRAEWGSKKARDLLKILAVRGGRSIAREELAELLWPGEAYETVANRLSVALSVVRGVLAADGGSRDGNLALVTDDRSVALDLDQVDVDVERFRRLAEDGLKAARTPAREGAIERLLAAEEAYGGDLLEDDRDELWLVDRREELRSLYVSVARTCARLVGPEDPDRAMRLLLRILDRDAYDEPAHLGVCRALLLSGRHGEARRRHRLYASRMDELGLPAVPLHDLHEPVAASGRRS